MDKVFDEAITDYYKNIQQEALLINNHYGEADKMPLDVYFRDENHLNGLESYALSLCRGKVLDVGAGAGALSIILQNREFAVDALEISQTLCNIMADKGVNHIINQDFFSLQNTKKYNTLLMMMNGFGISGTLDKLPLLLEKFDELLLPGGQVLFDSSDVRYLYDDKLPEDRYFGEIDYQYEYKGERGDWFKWLYIDIDRLTIEVNKYGYQLQVLSEDANGQYLGRLLRH